ncbi:MAG: DUF3098 domain-containing protein [Bacteroidia bacterium]
MASKKTNAKTEAQSLPKQSPNVAMTFTRKNYILLIIGVLIIAFGFFLLSLDGFVDAEKFSISLNVAPYIIVGGFAEIIYAIMYREKKAA